MFEPSSPDPPASPSPEDAPEGFIEVDLADICEISPRGDSDADSGGADLAGALDDADALDAAVDEGDERAVARLAARCSALHLRVAVDSAATLGRAAIADALLAAAEARYPDEVAGLVASAFGIACEAGDLETLGVLDRRGATARLAAAALTPPPCLSTRGVSNALEITLAGREWRRARLRAERGDHGVVVARLIVAGAPPTTRALVALLEEALLDEGAEREASRSTSDDKVISARGLATGRNTPLSGLDAVIARWEDTPELAAALDGIPGYRLGFGRGYRTGHLAGRLAAEAAFRTVD